MRDELLQQISEWLSIHPNPFDRDINEKAYRTILGLNRILPISDDPIFVKECKAIFERFKYYY